MEIEFFKMHGCGNDFIVIDNRKFNLTLNKEQIIKLSDRKKSIGFDQLLIIEQPTSNASAKMTIFNPDGEKALACGNGTRCVASFIANQLNKDEVIIETDSGLITAKMTETNQVTLIVDKPKFNYNGSQIENFRQGLDIAGYNDGFLVNVGNPHIIFFRDYVELLDISKIGPTIEHHNLFLTGINVSFAEIKNKELINLRVWERGAGETLACGTAACATFAAAHKLGLVDNKVTIALPGGNLEISLLNSKNISITGDYNLSFTGKIIL